MNHKAQRGSLAVPTQPQQNKNTMNSQPTKEALRKSLVDGITNAVNSGNRQFTVEIGNGWMHSCILKQGGPVGKPGDEGYVDKLADYYLPELVSASEDAASGRLKVAGCVDTCCAAKADVTTPTEGFPNFERCGIVPDRPFAEIPAAQKTCPKEQAIIQAKNLRVAIDKVLQDVKAYYKDCLSSPCIDAPHAPGFQFFLDPQEVPANIKLAQRALEDAVMRLGMTLKAIGAPTPYPNSYNPNSTAVEPTADGLKL